MILAGILAATMSTADSQMLVAASGVSENIVQDFFGKKLTEKMKLLTVRNMELPFRQPHHGLQKGKSNPAGILHCP